MPQPFSPRIGFLCFPAILITALAAFQAPSAPGQESEEGEKAEGPSVVKIEGVFESPKAAELKADTEEISSLVIKRIVPHGSEVEQGRNVVWFETDEIDKRVRDAEADLRLAELALREAEFKYEQFLETQKLDRESAERTRKRAQQDYDTFVQVDRDHQIKSAEFSLKNAQFSLENAKEELEQLEQMYREDDLTEESEEIVLKRARQAVESAEFRLEGAEIRTTQTIEQKVPREEEDHEESLERAELSYETTRRELDFARKRREQELDKERKKFADQEEKLQELRDERKRLVIAAPTSGFVFHGALTRGAIGDKPSTLEAGKSVTGDQVLATVVPRKPLQVRLTVPETQRRHVQAGAKAQVTPNAFPDQSFDATVKSVSEAPFAKAKYDCVLTVKLGGAAEEIVPTMGCQVAFEGETSEEEDEKDEDDEDEKDEDEDDEDDASDES